MTERPLFQTDPFDSYIVVPLRVWHGCHKHWFIETVALYS